MRSDAPLLTFADLAKAEYSHISSILRIRQAAASTSPVAVSPTIFTPQHVDRMVSGIELAYKHYSCKRRRLNRSVFLLTAHDHSRRSRAPDHFRFERPRAVCALGTQLNCQLHITCIVIFRLRDSGRFFNSDKKFLTLGVMHVPLLLFAVLLFSFVALAQVFFP